MRRIFPYLLPFALITLVLSALALSPLAPLAGAQGGQKISAAATRPSSGRDKCFFVRPRAFISRNQEDRACRQLPRDCGRGSLSLAGGGQLTERAAWVEAQNKVTFAYLEKIPFRGQLAARLEKLYNYPKFTAPARRGEYFFFTKNDGLQNQNVWYVQKGLDGTPEVLIDPNKFSADGTSRLGTFSLSKDGKMAVYGISKGGSDWQEYFVLDISAKKTLSDKLEWVKVSSVAWAGDGFYYSRYPAPEKGKELTSKNENHQVFFHKLGKAQSEDELVYEDKVNTERFHIVGTTDDERFAILTISDRGKGKKGNAVFFRDLTKGDKALHAHRGRDWRRQLQRDRQCGR